MSHSLTFLKNHIIFSTRYRVEWITDEAAPRLYAYIADIAKSKKTYVIEIGGIEDHVHILASFHASRSVAGVVSAIKSNSSRLGKELLDNEHLDGRRVTLPSRLASRRSKGSVATSATRGSIIVT